ncbi:Putative transcriptional regulator, TetR family [Mycobacteroides abscessus subsp. abscessus]|nr:hypothetical protein [Mycobacteroides abscessus]SHO82016.1 TetR family transcriptional regulator [Mycobacteroides abscessus subsp. abscessus]MBE5413194.1 hypothetical protein [Mycobacteroides abscessus]MBE5418253.1 hypothetical protein [Mycobacteroides abscessus]MBE5422159.1 hypothetical protein [Mycobacteroides abscessus]
MRGRPPLPMETIVDAALQIVDEEGGEALSMRALARRLDSGTATIYRHFANRTEVVAHVVDRVFGEVQLDDPALARMPWQDACIVSSRALFDALRRHPNVAMLLADQIPVGPNVFMIREHTLTLCLQAGFSPAEAIRIYMTLGRYVLGFANQIGAEHRASEADIAMLTRLVENIDLASYPSTLATAGVTLVPLDEEFDFGLGLIVAGLEGLRHGE